MVKQQLKCAGDLSVDGPRYEFLSASSQCGGRLTGRLGIPDLHYTVENAAAVGDKVWLRVRARGTDSGTGRFGHPPTGKPISIDVIDVARFADGQMIEHWGVPDRMSILQQLGLHA